MIGFEWLANVLDARRVVVVMGRRRSGMTAPEIARTLEWTVPHAERILDRLMQRNQVIGFSRRECSATGYPRTQFWLARLFPHPM
ncbi:hypothetical protein SIID45300_01051 [Candidatus Magnetaquicoccaceae bacterium FCR-1]|uniref:Transcriptional regulator n=1 Tax=Candidatus Magnetaquiglobus chichijimensis TaxID=3141448 RepID=A0ABQ0C774_9PROT